MAVKEYITDNSSDIGRTNSDILDRVEDIMKKLRTLKSRGRLRKLTKIGPIKRMDGNIRWSANYYMLKRYFELKPYFAAYNTDCDDPIEFLKPALETKALRLFKHLELLQSVTMALQSDDLDLRTSRLLLDSLISDFEGVHSCFEKYLAIDARVNKEHEFQSGLLKIVNKKEHELDEYEKAALTKFEMPIDLTNNNSVATSIEEIESNNDLTYSEKIIRKDQLTRKLSQHDNTYISKYVDISYCAGLSNRTNISYRSF